MKEQKDIKTPAWPAVFWIHLIGFVFLASSLSINPLKISHAFFSDEAVYYTMAYSFAYDGDMVFRRGDLLRVYKEYEAGPQGIILKLNERDGNLVFGKSFLYSLLASPFVRLLKTNGFLTFNVLLLWLNLLCGYRVVRSTVNENKAMLFSLFYFLANATLLYLFWMTPEYFNLSLVCYAFFFFVADEWFGSKTKILTAPYNHLISAVFFGMATYSKPTNALLIVPLGIWMLYRKKMLAASLTLCTYVIVTVALFGANVYFTGEWNYQGGRRASFSDRFPFERPGVSEFAPFKAKPPIQAMVRPPFYWKTFASNWLYFFFGRFSGLAVYFFPMFFGLIYFFFCKKDSLVTVIYIAGWVGIFTYMIGIPWNYFGGSGTIGNRYLLGVFPIFLFVIRRDFPLKLLGAACLLSLLFASAFLATPVYSSVEVDFHQKQSILRVLPVEKSLLNDLPSCAICAPLARRIAFDNPSTYFAYFVDDNTHFREDYGGYRGFWVKGGRVSEFILRAFKPASKMRVRLKSLKPGNKIEITVNGTATKIALTDSIFYVVDVPLPAPFAYDRDGRGPTFLYDIKIQPESGVITPMNWVGDRYLGVFVRLELPELEEQMGLLSAKGAPGEKVLK
jgi:hypothetical protein